MIGSPIGRQGPLCPGDAAFESGSSRGRRAARLLCALAIFWIGGCDAAPDDADVTGSADTGSSGAGASDTAAGGEDTGAPGVDAGVCGPGYRLTGSTCSDLNECNDGTHDCDANATCINSYGSFTCACKTGYEGDGKTCTAMGCEPGFQRSGPSCVDANECTGGTHDCDPNALCTNTVGSFTCACKGGYEGDGKACAATGCDPGFTKSGASCVDINECTGGSHGCDANATCTNSVGSHTCTCKAGYTGDGATCQAATVECQPGYQQGPSGTCVDLDECAGGNPCGVGTCSNLQGSWSCSCPTGYVAKDGTCADVDECAATPAKCSPDATCENTLGSFACTCKAGFTGDGKVCCGPGYEKSGTLCADIHECNKGTDDCDPNAACANTTGSFTCKCNTGFAGDGKTCADVDECATGTHNCDATTVCKNTVGAFTCDCAKGYEKAGSKCFDVDECLKKTDDCPAWCKNTPGGYQCLSTVADETSPWYTESCDPTFSFHQYNWAGTPPNETYEYRTWLVADCRCGENRQTPALGGLNICQNPSELPKSVKFGKGPSVHELPNSSILGGAFDTEARVIYAGVEWQGSFNEDQGAILTIDPDTGDRAILSGQWLDPANGYLTFGVSDPADKTFWTDDVIGEGPYKNPLGRVYDIEIGADGFLYAMTSDKDNYTHIVRVDVATGNRKVMWTEKRSLDPANQNEPAHIQCDNGASSGTTWVQVNQFAGFDLDANGDYLMPVIQQGTTTTITPNGIIRVKKDGSDCQWVTRFGMGTSNGFSGQTIGTGPLSQFAFYGLELHEGLIYAVSGNGPVYTIDPATGKRAIVASDTVGTGPLPGQDWLEWDVTRDIMWTGGTGLGTTIVSWELQSSARSGHMGLKLAKPKQFQTASGPLDTCCQTHRPGWVDPETGDLLLVFNVYAILRFEPASGNSVIQSL